MSRKSRTVSKKGIALNFVIGGAAGALAALVLTRLAPDFTFEGYHPWGLLIALLLAVIGGSSMVASTSPRRTAGVFGSDFEPGEDFAAEMRSLRWQAIVSLLAAVEMGLLSLSPEILVANRGGILAILAAVLALQTIFNLRLWRHGDEFIRRLIVDASVAAFLVFQILLFFWAAASRLEYLPDPGAFDIYVLMMGVYLVASGIVGIRRGLGTV